MHRVVLHIEYSIKNINEPGCKSWMNIMKIKLNYTKIYFVFIFVVKYLTFCELDWTTIIVIPVFQFVIQIIQFVVYVEPLIYSNLQ